MNHIGMNHIEEYAKIGIGHWATHDTDVIPTEALGKDEQSAIVSRIAGALKKDGLDCSMVTTETFYHAVWAASPAAEAPEVRDYAAFRVENTVRIGHELGAQFAVYWPGSLGYYVQGAIDETETLRWYAGALSYRRVRWFCRRPATAARLRDLVEHERMQDFISVEPLPDGVAAADWG